MLTPDSAREFLITRMDYRTGEVQLSIKRIEQALMWQRMRQLRDHKVTSKTHKYVWSAAFLATHWSPR